MPRRCPPVRPIRPNCRHRDATARAAGGHHRAVRVDPGRAEGLRQGLALCHRAVGVQYAGEWQVEGPGHMSGAQTGARLGRAAVEPVGGAGVQHLITGLKGGADGVEICDPLRSRRRDEGSGKRLLRRAGVDRTPLRPPFRQAAVEDAHVARAHGAEHPPDPGRGPDADGVIDDDTVSVRDPQPAHAGCEGVGRRQHVRQVALLVRGGFQIEEDCARQARGLEIRPAVAAVQMPAGVDESKGRIAETGGEVRGRDQGGDVGHGST